MQQLTENHNICVRIPRSHRKRNYFESFLGRKPQYLYSFRFSGNFVYVDRSEFEQVKKYVTRARVDLDKLLECWG